MNDQGPPHFKNRDFITRFKFANAGIKVALKTQASFRFQVICAAGVLIFLAVLRPPPIWWAIIILTVAAVLALELVNTALELVIDRLHPETHPLIAKSKDCAAGAVLVMSFASLGVFLAMIYTVFFIKA